MKRLIALILAGLMVLGGASLAASWPEGCSPAQPYSNLPEVNLSETMGYIMMFPRTKLPASRFCDVLAMYLPRTDLAIGKGQAHLYEIVEGEKKPVEICAIDFSDPDSVAIREMTEKELGDFMWGSGSCVSMYLSRSLEFGEHSYYVTMDEGCFTAADGKLKSIAISNNDAWVPVLQGEYGISGLRYVDAELPAAEPEAAEPEPEEYEDEEAVILEEIDALEEVDPNAPKKEQEAKPTPEPTEEPEAKPEPTEEPVADVAVVKPDAGDKVRFDLVIGGGAQLAVLYSENGSVEFKEIEYTESASIEGTVLSDDVSWGVAFYDANGAIFDTINVSR